MSEETDDKPLYSQCCGVEMDNWPESDLCPRCLEHTGVESEELDIGEDDEQ